MGPDTATGRMNAQAWERQQPPAAGGGRRIPPWSMGRGHSPQTPWSWTLASARGENAFLSFQAAPLGLLIYGSCRARRDEPRAEGRARPPDPADLQRRPDLGQEGCMGWQLTGPTDRQSSGWTEGGSHCRDNEDAVSSTGRPTRSSALK